MAEKRIRVWVQEFKDRKNLMLQWIDPDTNRIKSKSAKTASRDDAESQRTDLESDLNNNRYQEASRMTWERFRAAFEDEYVAGLGERTGLVYANVFNLFERVCNPKTMGTVTARTISAFVAGLRKEPGRAAEGMQASTIKVRLQFLHTALSWAVGQKIIRECPKFPSVKVPETNPQPVPVESFERIYAKAEGDPQMQAYLLTGWLAGLRLREACELEWEETDEAPYVDFAHERIVLHAATVKGRKDQWVPLDPVLRATLESLPRHGKKVFRFAARDGSRLSVYTISDLVVRLAKKAGVKLTMKSLRRGFGCRYAGKVPAQVLQKLMRHSDIKTTLKYYANVDDAVMEAVLGPRPNSLPNRRGSEGMNRPNPVDVKPDGSKGND